MHCLEVVTHFVAELSRLDVGLHILEQVLKFVAVPHLFALLRKQQLNLLLSFFNLRETGVSLLAEGSDLHLRIVDLSLQLDHLGRVTFSCYLRYPFLRLQLLKLLRLVNYKFAVVVVVLR